MRVAPAYQNRFVPDVLTGVTVKYFILANSINRIETSNMHPKENKEECRFKTSTSGLAG
jgi:hypothetical protein